MTTDTSTLPRSAQAFVETSPSAPKKGVDFAKRTAALKAAKEDAGVPEPVKDRPAAKVAPAAAIRTLILLIEQQLNATFAEREDEIRGLVVALLAREHVLLLGPAGTGKSALAHVFCSAIDGATYYQWLLTRFSTPEEVFGPVSLDGLKHDRFRRVTTGKLPEAHVAFLDEIFKANSAVLNSLLTALNERAFDNDGARHDIPLETMVGASNELPEGPELAALYDRFLLRYWTDYTTTPDAFRRLLTGDEPSIAARISMTDLATAQAEVAALPFDPKAVDELFMLRNELTKQGLGVSDRRWRKAVKILRAAAWVEGATTVTQEVFPILANVLWTEPTQRASLLKLVAKYASAELAEAQDVYDAMQQLLGELPAKGADDFAQRVTGVTREVKRAVDKITALKGTTKGITTERIDALLQDLTRRQAQLKRDVTEALGLGG